MLQVGAFEAKNTLGRLLDLVESGEEILITRHGRTVARLGPPARVTPEQRQTALAAMQRIRERAQAAPGAAFDWEEWKSYRDEGRR